LTQVINVDEQAPPLTQHERRLTTLEVQLPDLVRRLEKLENVPNDLAAIKSGLAVANATLEGLGARLAIVWSVVGIVLGGLVTLGLQLLRAAA
jgi:hypothetical protein